MEDEMGVFTQALIALSLFMLILLPQYCLTANYKRVRHHR